MLKPKISNPNNKITGCKVEGQIKPKMTIKESKQQGYTESDQQDIFMASKQNPSQIVTPNKTKKKKKKKSKKSSQKSKTEIQKSGFKTKKSISQVIPWGVNQQRLRNYILAEQQKYYNAIQRRNTRTTVDLKERRQQIGTSFLNQYIEKNLKSMMKKKKSFHDENQPKQKLKISTALQQQYKKLGSKSKNFNILPNRMKMSFIHYPSPAQKVQKRNRSLSQGQQNKPIQINRIRTGSLYEKPGTLFEAPNLQLKFNKAEKQKRIVLQYQNIEENYLNYKKLGCNSSKNQSKPQSSLYKLMSNSSSNNIPNDSDGEQNIQDLDDSFYSQKNILDTHSEEEEAQKIEETNIFQCTFPENYNEEYYFKKENFKKITLPQNTYSVENQAAVIIQKVWKGYQVRKKIFKSKFQQNKDNKTKDGLNLKSLTKSQINKLIKFGFLKKGSIDNSQLIDESSFVSQSRPNSQIDNQKDTKKINESNQYQKFIENFQDDLDCRPNSSNQQNQVSSKFKDIQLQIISEYTPEKIKKSYQHSQDESFGNQKSKKISKLSIDVEEQEEENKVDIGEIRCAFGSESLLKSLSQEGEQSFQQDKGLFEQTSFQDFVMNKFKELMQRDKMDQLIALREEAVQQRQQQSLRQIDKAFQNNQISPRTFEVQQRKVEKWVNKQKNDLEQKKREILKGQQSVFDAIVKTQRDLQFVKQMLSSQNSQTYIKIVDNLSQESANYSENSLKSSIIDIQISNSQMLQSQQDDKNKAYDDVVTIQRKSNNILEEKELICPEPFNLKKLAQSQFVRNVEQLKEPQKISEKCADSYSILISNMLIQEEVNSFYIEMQRDGIDLYELISKSQFNNKNQIVQPKEQKIQGLKTNVAQIKSYLKYLEEYLIDNLMIQIQRIINIPLGPSSQLMLKFLQPIRDSAESDYDSNGAQQQIILNVELFGKFERFLMEQRIINHQNKLIIELEHIHNKAIFDSLNEALDQFRPYGLHGQPFLWKSDPTRLRARENQLTDVPQIIRKASDKVIDWSHYMAGILVDKEDSPFPKSMQLDQETIAQIREDRLYRMLTLDIIDNEDRWTNYDEETTEISIDLSDLLFDFLIEEVAYEMYKK
ncbi:unnamed protein product (macronuclear) [Paramecium tetraurelia]|uniref:DUF4378 domain-containing protein n=1 Tax=Paramecium tetraurelia TaxID=5888 RepID=A0CSC4_PARTE|nr:uncharacterized protein GSPATT00009963001 [Paramecium tetraurelia]CAK73691.1 unnamed protein product [Paramecium tetraurelia]|eukprot:XP_001441088.1 hypothetical protein (macronuclear) [Paramecium tetraurelia strain d4-2]